jgi:hypothetical protein
VRALRGRDGLDHVQHEACNPGDLNFRGIGLTAELRGRSERTPTPWRISKKKLMANTTANDEGKARLGTEATCVWLIGGAILFLVDGGLSNLFSVRAAVFLGVGMFAAAIIVGGISYIIRKMVAGRLMMLHGDPSLPPSQGAMRNWRSRLRLLNLALSILFVIGAYATLH